MTESTEPTDDEQTLGVSDFAAELLDDWRWLLGGLHARFKTGDFATGLRLVEEIGAAAEEANHHPDVDLRYPFVQVSLRSHDVGGVTQRDVRLAREIGEAAGRLGAKSDVASLSLLELGLDSAAHEDIRPFWAAVLGVELDDEVDDEIRDGGGLLPTVWFQDAPSAREESPQRWHLDVTVAAEVAEQRVKWAVEAGGTLVSDARKPSFWVLVDAQGNQACICTPLGRTENVPVEDSADETDETDETSETSGTGGTGEASDTGDTRATGGPGDDSGDS